MRPLHLLTLALTAPSALLAQDYRMEQNAELMIEYGVHEKLSPIPIKAGTSNPHIKARYEATSESDKLHGPHGSYPWELYVFDFPKNGIVIDPDKPQIPTTEEGDEGQTTASRPRVLAKDFSEWARIKGPQNERKFLVKGKKIRGNRNQPPMRVWIFTDEYQNQQLLERHHLDKLYWWSYACVYELPDREVALLCNLPLWEDRQDKKLVRMAQTMTHSLKVLESDDVELRGADRRRDEYADTAFKKQELEKAKANIESLKNWDYFTSPNYIVLFSWPHDRNDKRLDSFKFARNMVQNLEACREGLYVKDFPPHEDMTEAYSILRVCSTREEFERYGGTSRGVVGWYNPGSKELVIFNDTQREYGNDDLTLTVCFHEGWHQYANLYFGDEATLHRWFGEGMGDYFGSFRRKGRGWDYEYSRGRFQSIRAQIARESHIPVQEIITWNIDKFYNSRRTPQHYAQGYSMVDFLRRGPGMMGRAFEQEWEKIIPTYCEVMKETKDQDKAMEAAWENVDFDQFEEAWKLWVKRYMKK